MQAKHIRFEDELNGYAVYQPTIYVDGDGVWISEVRRRRNEGTKGRGLTMDDAHIFLREDQIEDEIFRVLDIVELVLGKRSG